jgi:hypothetical protein
MSAEDATHLEFLTRDGVVSVEFRPAVPDEAYDELLKIAKQEDSAQALRDSLIAFSQRWGLAATVD